SALRTAKLSASLASRIKTKTINNSSTLFKVSLKHNNKALALALNEQKANAQRLTQERAALQRELEQCHFQNAVLRHKLSAMDKTLTEFENLMAPVVAWLSKLHTSSASLCSGQKSSCVDETVDGQLLRAIGMPMRVPISKPCHEEQQGISSTAVQTSLLELQIPASNEPLKSMPVASKDTLPPQPAEKPKCQQEEDGKKLTEAVETPEAFLDSCILGENLSYVQTEFEGDENVPPRSVPGRKASKIPRAAKRNLESNKKQTGDLQEKEQAKTGNNTNALSQETCCKSKPQRKRKSSKPPETDSLARQSDGARVHIESSTELAAKQTVLMGKFSCITDLLSDQDGILEEQIPEIWLTNQLMDLPQSLESSSLTHSEAWSASSRLTDAAACKSLSNKGNRTPVKFPVQPKCSLIVKEKTAEEIPVERNQAQSSSQSSPSQEPELKISLQYTIYASTCTEIRPLQDLNNTRIVSSTSLEEESGSSTRRRRNPVCYKEPKLNSKLRQGDPFTDTKFLCSLLNKTQKKPVKAKKMTKKIKEENQRLPEGCPSAQASKFMTARSSLD
ncbi:PREDICTED: uncharacterized protein LOC103806747, partial [Acanthisitta chloris]|uniref:uncharacterized protein LOC103806747 n=1 Tax=Acanthisitta chloris TaxID=57068 RepID=UPI0004F0FFB3